MSILSCKQITINEWLGYEPKLEKTCLACGYFRTIVDATTCEPIEKRCNPGDGYSYAVSYPETYTCEKWKEATHE